MSDLVGIGDIQVWAGANSPPVEWEFLAVDIPDDQGATPADLVDLTGSVLHLTIGRNGETIIDLNTEDDEELVLQALAVPQLAWTPTLAQTRLLPNGRVLKYEIERRIGGEQQPFAAGWVVVDGGLNSD